MNSCWKMKIQNEKPLGHSASRSSNISKAGSPTSVNAPCSFSRTSVSPSSQDICSSSQDQGSKKQTAVVLLNSNGKISHGSGSVLVATLCTDAPPPWKQVKQRDWLSLLRPASVNIRPGGSLRFSVSLNDVGQRVDGLCRGLHFIDRTCSDGELDTNESTQRPGSEQRAQTLNPKLIPTHQSPNGSRTQPHLIPSLTNNHKYMLGLPTANHVPTDSTHVHPSSAPGSHFLRVLLPFSRSSTTASFQCSEMGSYASHLHMNKSSSTLLEGAESGFPSQDPLGSDDVFDAGRSLLKQTGQPGAPEAVTVPGVSAALAPLCYMDEDNDLECCSSPLSEKTGPLSPFSLSADCC
ncbi:E3 ubiquitin-protein ligase MARCH8, partial [Oryzias melastigma]